MDSIRQNLTKDVIVAEIKMMLSSDINHELNFVIVEGQDDITFLDRKIKNVQLYESYSGKQGVKEVVDFFNNERVIGICDKDYDEEFQNGIFYYDHSCLEMMIVCCDDAFENFVNTNYHGEKHFSDLRMDVFENLKEISYLRFINARDDLKLNMKGISFYKLFNSELQQLDREKLFNELINSNKSLANRNRSTWQEVKELCNKKNDLDTYLNITQGHDFICLFKCFCDYAKVRKKDVSIESLIRSLFTSYRFTDFCETQLYKSLMDYGLKFVA